MGYVHQLSDDHAGRSSQSLLKSFVDPEPPSRHAQEPSMKSLVPLAMIGAIACAGFVGASTGKILAGPDENQSVLEADQALIQLLGKGSNASLQDHLGLAELLDEDFIWIDSNGKSRKTAQILNNVRTPANSDVEVQERSYGRSALVRANRGNVQVLRVWAKRAQAWRVVLYQEVTLVAKSDASPA